MTTALWLAFTPRDTIFVRDGRSFDAAEDLTAQAVSPGPSTIGGSVAAALRGEPDEVRGPVLAQRAANDWELRFPAPADLVKRGTRVYRLAPVGGIGGTTDLETRDTERTGGDCLRWLVPPSGAEAGDPLRAWLSGNTLARYLKGDLPADGGSPSVDFGVEEEDGEEEDKEPLLPEPRIGLARDERGRARTGYLYQAAHLRLREDWGFLAQCVFSESAERVPSGPVQLGGRGRLADVVPAEKVDWPAHPEGEVGRRVLVYLATPALWRTGWRIPLPCGASLVAAATGEPEPMATAKPGEGWKDSRVLRWAVPAGAVYLLEFPDGERGARWARTVHGTAYCGERDDERLRTAGFGVLLTGVWSD